MTLLYLEQLLVTLILLNDVDKNLDDDDGNSGDYIDETPLHPSYIEAEEALNEFHNLFLLWRSTYLQGTEIFENL